MSIDIAFSRTLLAGVVADLKQHFPAIKPKKDAWVWKAGRDHWEFHGPNKYYWHGGASNAYEARANGWMAWMESKGVKGYVRGEDAE